MKPIEEVYPNCISKVYSECAPKEVDYEYFNSPGDYNPLIESFGYGIVIQVDDNDYQGDSRVLFKNDEKFGILIFGWGSCSGCDALQGCANYKEIEKLRNDLLANIKWFDNKNECLKYIETKDWKGDYSWQYEETKEFIKKCKKYLKRKKKK